MAKQLPPNLERMLPVIRHHFENRMIAKGEYTRAQADKRLSNGNYLHIGLQKGWEDFIEFMQIAHDIFGEKMAV